MALKDLSTEAMIATSKQILNPPANRPQTQNKEELYSGLLVLRRAHDNLVKVNRRDGEVREQIKELTVQLGELDLEHDRCSRGIHRMLSGAADITTDEKRAANYLKAIDILHPNGTSVNLLSYTEQAGNTMRVAERVTPELRQFLATVIIDGTPLDTVLDRWLVAGQTIGELQSERDMLNTDQDPERVTPAIIQDARNQWIRAANAFIAALDSTDFTEEEKTTILAHLRATEAQAMSRRKKPDAVGELATPDAPENELVFEEPGEA